MVNDSDIIFKPESKNILKIFCDSDSYYKVPDYQREYAWEDENIEQLFDDIYFAMESKEETYFLGSLILIKNSDHYEVIDGQQRLTTLTILFCVIRDFYKEGLKKINETIVNKIEDSIKSMVEGKVRLNLVTQSHKQNEFEQEILEGIKLEKLIDKENKSKFIKAASILRDKIIEISKEPNDIKKLNEFISYILNKVQMITIICSKQIYAIKLFQILNTRGMDLSTADLLKSHLYSKIEDEQQKNQFMCTWREILNLSEQYDEILDNFLTYYVYYLKSQNPKSSILEELYKYFGKEDSNSVIYNFKNFIKTFVNIYDIESKVIFSFRYLPNQIFWKTILATAKYENINYFEDLCKELRRLYYSYWIAGYTTTKVKQLSFNLIRLLKEKKSIKDLKQEIDKKMKEDKVIDRVNENITGDVYNKPWLKPLLILIEYEQIDISKTFYIEISKNIHIDHILPIGWNSVEDWKRLWNEEQAQYWLNKIGNLTLLSSRKNIAQHNDPPARKKEMYEKSHGGKTAFEISKKVIESLNNWNENKVKERQEWMIKEIKKILTID